MKYITYMFSTIKLKFFIHIELFWITIRESLYKRITFNSIYHSGREYAPRRYWIGSLSTSIRRCQSFSPVRYIAWSPDLRSTWKISCHVIHRTYTYNSNRYFFFSWKPLNLHPRWTTDTSCILKNSNESRTISTCFNKLFNAYGIFKSSTIRIWISAHHLFHRSHRVFLDR